MFEMIFVWKQNRWRATASPAPAPCACEFRCH